MTSESTAPPGMSEILAMAGELAERLLGDQAEGRDLPDDQVRALVKAAMLLEEHGVPWPPTMMQVLQAIDRSRSAEEPVNGGTDGASDDRDRAVGDPGSDAEGIVARIVSFGRRRR